MFCSTNLWAHEHPRLLFAVWIAIVGWWLRELQWKADAEDNECSCYDVTPRGGTSIDAFLADDTIFDGKRQY
jgi:hypothetical protein